MRSCGEWLIYCAFFLSLSLSPSLSYTCVCAGCNGVSLMGGVAMKLCREKGSSSVTRSPGSQQDADILTAGNRTWCTLGPCVVRCALKSSRSSSSSSSSSAAEWCQLFVRVRATSEFWDACHQFRRIAAAAAAAAHRLLRAVHYGTDKRTTRARELKQGWMCACKGVRNNTAKSTHAQRVSTKIPIGK